MTAPKSCWIALEKPETMHEIGRVECGLSGRQSENQPAMARIDRLETENVAKKSAVRFGVFTVDN
jgi:hypothetical protein